MVELNPINVRICKKIFKWIDPKAKPNIFKGSFLTPDYKNINPKIQNKFSIEKYDVIMGNPPFNKPTSLEGHRNQGGKTLWDMFFATSFNILKKGGYLTFINPQTWRGFGRQSHILDLIKNYKLLYLHIYKDVFEKISQPIDVYVIHKVPNHNYKTKIVDEKNITHRININEWPFIPNYGYDKFENIITEPLDSRVLYDASTYESSERNKNLKSIKTDKFKYKILMSITDQGFKKKIKYSNIKNKLFQPKFILNSAKLHLYPEQNDYKGEYGTSQNIFSLPIKNKSHGLKLLKAFNTQQFRDIINSTKWNGANTKYEMFKYFKKDFYKYFI
jgi:hypothetical protein